MHVRALHVHQKISKNLFSFGIAFKSSASARSASALSVAGRSSPMSAHGTRRTSWASKALHASSTTRALRSPHRKSKERASIEPRDESGVSVEVEEVPQALQRARAASVNAPQRQAANESGAAAAGVDRALVNALGLTRHALPCSLAPTAAPPVELPTAAEENNRVRDPDGLSDAYDDDVARKLTRGVTDFVGNVVGQFTPRPSPTPDVKAPVAYFQPTPPTTTPEDTLTAVAPAEVAMSWLQRQEVGNAAATVERQVRMARAATKAVKRFHSPAGDPSMGFESSQFGLMSGLSGAPLAAPPTSWRPRHPVGKPRILVVRQVEVLQISKIKDVEQEFLAQVFVQLVFPGGATDPDLRAPGAAFPIVDGRPTFLPPAGWYLHPSSHSCTSHTSLAVLVFTGRGCWPSRLHTLCFTPSSVTPRVSNLFAWPRAPSSSYRPWCHVAGTSPSSTSITPYPGARSRRLS